MMKGLVDGKWVLCLLNVVCRSFASNYYRYYQNYRRYNLSFITSRHFHGQFFSFFILDTILDTQKHSIFDGRHNQQGSRLTLNPNMLKSH